MIQKIVMFEHGIETLEYFSKQLGKTFEQMGYEIFYFDLCDEYESMNRLIWFCEPGKTAVIAFNFDGISGEDIFLDVEGVSFWEDRKVPYINIVVDHPFYYHKFLPYLPTNYYQISIDKDHEDYLKRFFPEMKRGPLLPLAGTTLWTEETLPGYDKRPYDIVFTGNYTPCHDFDKVITRLDDNYTRFYQDIIDDLICHPHRGMDEVIEEHLWKEVDEMDEEGLKDTLPNMIMIDLYVRHYFRGLVVKTLVDAGLKVRTIGAGWDRLDCKHPENIIDGKVQNSEECLKEISKAKISLNVMPWFKKGAHDRVFNSMLNGAVCFTDWSQFFEDHLHDGKDVMIYELDQLEQLPIRMRELLADRKCWKQMSRAGFQQAKHFHTWRNRARVLQTKMLCKL